MFVNGDAMGKSLQGASGSLVLGVVFNAYVNRTKYVPGAANVSPEEWLIKCFRELQDVFISFDGSMLISVVMGIIDDATGIMYYFNAEHPWTVLYRRGIAEFTEQELLNRKIGTTIGAAKVELRTLELQPGDIVIAGSDGRDDIMVGYDDVTGMRIINEDEKLFLEAVERGEGNLKEIVDVIKERGELTDDLSLLKIGYKVGKEEEQEEIFSEEFLKYKSDGLKAYSENNYEEAIKHLEHAIQISQDLDTYLGLINSLMRQKNFVRALFFVKKAIQKYPGNLKMIYSSAILHKKEKEYDEALYYSRRYYIHKPNDVRILIILADLFRLRRERHNFEAYLRKAEEIFPTHQDVKKLKKYLHKK